MQRVSSQYFRVPTPEVKGGQSIATDANVGGAIACWRSALYKAVMSISQRNVWVVGSLVVVIAAVVGAVSLSRSGPRVKAQVETGGCPSGYTCVRGNITLPIPSLQSGCKIVNPPLYGGTCQVIGVCEKANVQCTLSNVGGGVGATQTHADTGTAQPRECTNGYTCVIGKTKLPVPTVPPGCTLVKGALNDGPCGLRNAGKCLKANIQCKPQGTGTAAGTQNGGTKKGTNAPKKKVR